MNHEAERKKDVTTILTSSHPRRVVVAGPGTGKSFLFEQAIKKEKASGKTRFLAITFIGKLGDALADDLAGLAETATLHGFARKLVLDNCPKGWEYYPEVAEIIAEDLQAKKISKFTIGDENYKERSIFYKAVGQDDVVHYAAEICSKTPGKIPTYDLILVDEFQDFNEVESRLIDLLATKNKVLIVGDDDQALYEFKGSSPRFIRERFAISNTEYESHTLRFCSRCTPVIIDAFHDVVGRLSTRKKTDRIQKEYVCYLPEKQSDGELNPNILLMRDTMPGQVPMKIKSELSGILAKQKIKSVLIIGEGRSCKASLSDIAQKLRLYGFTNVEHRPLNDGHFTLKRWLVAGYRILAKGTNDTLAWRILMQSVGQSARTTHIARTYGEADKLVSSLSDEVQQRHRKNAGVLEKILTKSPSEVRQIGDGPMQQLLREVVENAKADREVFAQQLIAENKSLPRPLGSLDITVCNILGSKGLGADVVFLIGFDQGKLPVTKKPKDSEVYQLLVALTRAKKRLYLINTGGKEASVFLGYLKPERVKEI